MKETGFAIHLWGPDTSIIADYFLQRTFGVKERNPHR